ncbi:MAG: uroporphyrinogen-III C-methyltransferase [Gammaproteobacteria bacterium]|nr:uroporphyrinogen-III C-methyltransferase [Gammaproteobacteria bacterium]
MSEEACVYLVGAGPGDPDLLTLKAHRLLQEADVVVYDRLVSQEILDLVPTGTSRIFVGKAAGNHHMRQEDINELLANLARRARKVVRLKGGDPLIFGRGSEEALHLARHGVRFEIVPGITAASACTTYAGIPLTHRGLAGSARFVAGHCRADQPLDLDWDSLADPDTTLVIYMGLANLPEIAARLIAAGLAADTPAALIENGSTPRQRRLLTRLDALAATALSERVTSPALVVIGRVVALAGEMDWFGTAPAEHHADRSAQA